MAEPEGDPAELQEIDLREMGRLIVKHGLPDLPWQISGQSITQLTPPFQAFQLGDAYIAISSPQGQQITVRSLLVKPETWGHGQAEKLLQGLFVAFPDKEWAVPAIFPEEFTHIFEQVGFTQGDLTQLQMKVDPRGQG